jgi:hypothetical protein
MTQVVHETLTTERHAFWIVTPWNAPGAFEVQFRPLNPKTGKPWQASHRVTIGADVETKGWEGRPQWFSTLEMAQQAMIKQAQKLTKPRKGT